ncbi:MAG: c-type cytochrome, partial [Verrucomicrobiota bacterium]
MTINGVFLCNLGIAQTPATKPVAGLSISYVVSGKTDTTTAPNVWLYVPAGKPPTPFLPGGKFSATWEGFISADLRGDYAFQMERNGNLKLEINGAVVLETNGTNSISKLSKSVRLNKGTNALRATLLSPAQGDASVRLLWKPRDSFMQPIPSAALSHLPTTEEQDGKQLRLGRELFAEHRCAKCHVIPKFEMAMPELDMDAPTFENIGARRNYHWMARWISDPKSLRYSAHMPKVFADESAKTNSEAIAAFLASLKSASEKPPVKELASGQNESGKKLFETLHCTACHNAPDSSESDPKKISLKNIREKFAPGTLINFLKQPEAHYAWIRMPRFKLSDEHREQIAAYLLFNGEKPTETAVPIKETIENGKKLVQSSGCLNCHSLKLENQFSTKTLPQI